MGRGNYEDTQQKILSSAQKYFLEHGFERTNLRDLCADAGITTGSLYRHFRNKEDLFSALVQPAVDDIQRLFKEAGPVCDEIVEKGEIRGLWKVMDAKGVLDYIYRNFEALKLLLECADGTKYSGFLNDVVILETDITMRCFKAAKAKGLIPKELPSETELHMICHAYISSLFESVLHDLERAEMEKYVNTIVKFFEEGSYAILGI